MSTTKIDGQMSILEHLKELRSRLLISFLAIFVGACIAFVLAPYYFDWTVSYYRDAIGDQKASFIFLSPLDAFLVRLKIATYGGIVLAMPVVLLQMWKFTVPALKEREKKMAGPFVLSAMVLFVLGGYVAVLTLEPSLNFLVGIGGDSLRPELTADSVVTFLSLMIVAFGVSFEFPVVLVFLLLVRAITTAQLRKWRRVAFVAIITFAAVITPSQDPYSLFFMAIPMWLFYEAAILIGRGLKR